MSSEILDPIAKAEEAAPSRRRLAKIGVIGWVSLGVITLALLLALLGPVLRPFDPNSSDLSFANVGPFGSHLLGFDGQGRDVMMDSPSEISEKQLKELHIRLSDD